MAKASDPRSPQQERSEMGKITELDYALNCAAIEIDTTNARNELAQLRADLDAAVQRGNTYRRRAMALRRQAKAWRATSEYNNEQASYFQDVSIHLRELLNGEVKP